MVRLADALRVFLTNTANEFNRDLIERFLSADAEVQVNIRTDIGELVEEGKRTRTHDGIKFYPIRHPKNAKNQPKWEPCKVYYPFELFVEETGSTGFTAEGSRWVAFDLDTIAGHAPGVGVPDQEIERICAALSKVDYAEVRRSTRGKGRHVYVLLDSIKTENHTEHAALARAILGQMCHDAGLDFAPAVDTCGGNIWFQSRRATIDNRGFELLKPCKRILTADDIPCNWRDHLDVVTRKRTAVRVENLDEEAASSHEAVPKDAEHDRIFAEYRKHGYSLIYQPDFNCYQLHTAGLAATHKALGLRGGFETFSSGDDPGQPNAFAFLRPNGGLFVVRFGTPTEHAMWSKTSKGQPCATFNVPFDAETVCRTVGGMWTGSGFTCLTVAAAKEAATLFGVELPDVSERPINFSAAKSRLTIECERNGKEVVAGWGIVGRKLRRLMEIDSQEDDGMGEETVRHLVTPSDDDAGWAMRRADGSWGFESKDTLKDSLVHDGLNKTQAAAAVGKAAKYPWVLVNEPFQQEFLPGRRWNRHGRKLIVPADGPEFHHPYYDSIFEHCGLGLDDAVAGDEWCARHGIATGADYLRLWAASLIQQPKHPLPYLFFWSSANNTGKSAFHRCLGMLFDGGATDIHPALVENFNQQLAGAVLCYVEEKDISPAGYTKLKSWIDAPSVSIREMRTNAYMLPNYAHFVQTANKLSACPIEPEDERIVVIPVFALEEKIPWTKGLKPLLEKEAPDFLATLLAMQLPPAADRLYLPVLDTPSKREIIGEASSTGERTAIINALVARVIELASNWDCWEGFGGNLLAAIGPGPWSESPGTLVSYLQEALDQLEDRGVVVSISSTRTRGQRKITIGQSWLVEPERPVAEVCEDETRVANLLHELSATTGLHGSGYRE